MFLVATLLALVQQGIPTEPRERFERRVTPEVKVVELCKPAVVFIQTNGRMPIGRNFFGQLINQEFAGQGSGVVVNKQGFVITNYHVVRNASTIRVSFAADVDDADYAADLVSFVEEEDLALLKIVTGKNDPKEFPTISLGTSADLMLGERVVAIGNPYGQTHTVSNGIISGLHRNVDIAQEGLKFDDLIQTDAAINQGNSGGPLLNINGELIGINSSMNRAAQNIGFAIPVDRVKAVMQYRLTSPDAARTWLGFEVDNLQVSKVFPGSPAEEVGLKPGDCIVNVNGRKVGTSEEYRLARIALAPDAPVDVTVERAGKARSMKLAPWKASAGMVYQRLGIRCDEIPLSRDRALRVLSVRPGSPAAELGLDAGDVFAAVRVLPNDPSRRATSMNPAYRIHSESDLAEVLGPLSPGTRLEVEIWRDLNGDDRLTSDERHRGTLGLQ